MLSIITTLKLIYYKDSMFFYICYDYHENFNKKEKKTQKHRKFL